MNWVSVLPSLGLACLCELAWAGDGPSGRCQLTVLSVLLNDVPVGAVTENAILLNCGGRLYAKREDLSAWSLRPPASETGIQFDGTEYQSLDEIPGVTYAVEARRQELHISASSASFPSSSFRGAAAPFSRSGKSGTGAFLNYEVGIERQRATSGSIFGEAGGFGPWGLVTTTFVRRSFSNGGPKRLDTALVHDWPGRLRSLRIGDSLTQSGTWGRAMYFGGVQWGTDFATRPDVVTFPAPAIHGEAVTPSTAELYVNNALRWTSSVPAGPFDIVDPPLIAGAGDVTLVVRDLQGREQSVTQPYFVSEELLRRGMADYHISLGKVRSNYGSRNFSYGRMIGTAQYRRGLADRLTMELRGEAGGALRDAGATFSGLVLRRVVASFGAVGSVDGALRGTLFLGGVEVRGRRVNAGVDGRHATRGFRQLGLDRQSRPLRQIDSAFVGASLFGRDHAAISVYRQRGDTRLDYASASYSISAGRQTFLSLTVSATLSAPRRCVFSFGITHQFGERTSASVSATSHDGKVDSGVAVQRSLPMGKGVGYRVFAQRGPLARTEGEVNLRTETNEFQLQAYQSSGANALRTSVQGAVATLGGKTFVTRQIADSFAVVKVGDYRGVQVLSENQPIAVTGKDGVAVVPRLLSYVPNHLSIDPKNLPLRVVIDATSLEVTPGRRNGVRVKFPVCSQTSALLELVDEAESPIPTPATVKVEGMEQTFPLGLHGLTYLTGFPPGAARLIVTWAGGQCHAETFLEGSDGSKRKRVVCHSGL